MLKLGIDIGSRNTKLVVYNDQAASILFYDYCSTDVAVLKGVNQLIEKALTRLGSKATDFDCIGVTGYGRKLFTVADSTLSEISCHAAGCRHFFPQLRTVVDIGGQDSKIILLDASGKVIDFIMNDKCAAGTGRFLEMTALRLGCEIDQLSELSANSTNSYKLNSTCVVFAESEIIDMMSNACSRQDIAKAVNESIVHRISSQMSSLAWTSPVVFTGGVAKNNDLAKCLSDEIGSSVLRCHEPEITGALGAAILARRL